jgi:hypothetical protein
MKTFILGMKKEATMKRAFVALFFSLALVLPAASAWSQPNFPIVSANGFSCSQTGGMVSCRGGFPGEPSPILEATGYNVVWLRAEYSGYRYTYYSDSGCLCRAEFKSGETCGCRNAPPNSAIKKSSREGNQRSTGAKRISDQADFRRIMR